MSQSIPPDDPNLAAAETESRSQIVIDQQEGASATGAAIELERRHAGGSIGRYRWIICSLLFFATTVNYMDRAVFGILAPKLGGKDYFHWTEEQYSYIVMAFQAAYAIGLLAFGRILDAIGTRLGYALAIVVWALSSIGHALARSWVGFGVARFCLGIGESGNFPAAIKTTAEWFPRKERALATGVFNSGSNVGAILAPLTVPFIFKYIGWQWAFVFTGCLDLIWLVFWLIIYRRPEEHFERQSVVRGHEHELLPGKSQVGETRGLSLTAGLAAGPLLHGASAGPGNAQNESAPTSPARWRLSPAELAYIRQDPPEPETKIPWLQLVGHRQAWAFAIGKFMTDPIWWFFLFWLPKFLNKQYGLTITEFAAPLIVIYVAADFGSVGGGWLSSRFLKLGWSVNAARKSAMLLCALCVVPIIFASHASHVWVAVALISLATAAHQGWSANIFTLVSDMFPRRAVGSVVGFGGMFGAIGGMCIAWLVGELLQMTGSYFAPFLLAGSAYLLALLAIHLLVPRLEPADVNDRPGATPIQ